MYILRALGWNVFQSGFLALSSEGAGMGPACVSRPRPNQSTVYKSLAAPTLLEASKVTLRVDLAISCRKVPESVQKKSGDVLDTQTNKRQQPLLTPVHEHCLTFFVSCFGLSLSICVNIYVYVYIYICV